MSKTYELILGYRIFVTGESLDEVKTAGRQLAKSMKVFPARDITVKESLPEKSDGRWVIEEGNIQRLPVELNTLVELTEFASFEGDLAHVAEDDAMYMLIKDVPPGFDKRALKPCKSGNTWVNTDALAAYMKHQNGG